MSEHAYTYHGKGEHLAGVPARHLSQADVDALGPEAREEFHRHVRRRDGLYQKAEAPAQAKGNRRRRAKVADVSKDAVQAQPDEPVAELADTNVEA